MIRPPFLLAGLLACTACDDRPADRPGDPAWEQPRRVLVADGIERLPSGDCLDAHRLLPPWRRGRNGAMLADAAALGVVQTGYDWGGDGGPGTVAIAYGAWVPPPPDRGYWAVAPPSRLARLLRSGAMVPVGPAIGHGLRGYRMAADSSDDRSFVDRRRLTQCQASGRTTRCTAVAARRDWSFGLVVDAGRSGRLPALLSAVEAAVERTRVSCPDRHRQSP